MAQFSGHLFFEIAYILLAYFIGAVPTAYWVVKKLKGVDIRNYGSGNVGATNVKRVAGGKAALFVLFCDFLKGFLAVLTAKLLFPGEPAVDVIVAMVAIIGHSRSIFLGFSGGKSAATGLGTLIALSPSVGLLAGLTAIVVFKFTKIVSAGSLSAALVFPVLMFLFHDPVPYQIFALVSMLYILYLHRTNIGRLIKGTEKKLE